MALTIGTNAKSKVKKHRSIYENKQLITSEKHSLGVDALQLPKQVESRNYRYESLLFGHDEHVYQAGGSRSKNLMDSFK